ncbi:MAG TPA: hypothetical protein VHY77_10925, partial [Acidimicrobiales bacterium]|nr:hypothetical protein [Acidimicrobiales bacterium]
DAPHMHLYVIYPVIVAFITAFMAIGLRNFRHKVLSWEHGTSATGHQFPVITTAGPITAGAHRHDQTPAAGGAEAGRIERATASRALLDGCAAAGAVQRHGHGVSGPERSEDAGQGGDRHA